ncbi:MAG TPA: GDP-mannose 4,6-dehydratase [Maribacter sp.]|nr:GDP-mannose 4,6-dehydratase [Maribacter sp.]
MKKRAIITGINGMDGSHLADLLLEKDYKVYGMERRSSTKNRINTAHLESESDFDFVPGDLTDQNSLLRLIKSAKPHEVYNLGAQSFVGASWGIPEQTSNVTGLGVLRVLEAIREYGKPVKFYQASSSEMFGNTTNLQLDGNRTTLKKRSDELTPFYPRSPYGVAKMYGHWMCKNYRESYKMFNCSGILFNHEGERRGHEFVTRKISDGVARIHLGLQDSIALGNLDSRRDWGYAPDYVEAMWMMLQHHTPGDYVIATGESHSIRDFLSAAFAAVDIEEWEQYVTQDPRYMRPAEVDVLCGDYSKAEKELGWKPKTNFSNLVNKMVTNDIALVKKELQDDPED